jgi:hypothetical protein
MYSRLWLNISGGTGSVSTMAHQGLYSWIFFKKLLKVVLGFSVQYLKPFSAVLLGKISHSVGGKVLS